MIFNIFGVDTDYAIIFASYWEDQMWEIHFDWAMGTQQEYVLIFHQESQSGGPQYLSLRYVSDGDTFFSFRFILYSIHIKISKK